MVWASVTLFWGQGLERKWSRISYIPIVVRGFLNVPHFNQFFEALA